MKIALDSTNGITRSVASQTNGASALTRRRLPVRDDNDDIDEYGDGDSAEPLGLTDT
jgi:hypothetical protein